MKALGNNGSVRLRNVTIPGCLIGKSDDLIVTDLSIEGDQIVDGGGQDIEMDRSMVLPCFVDMHTHLDKGHIWPRAANPDGTFDGVVDVSGPIGNVGFDGTVSNNGNVVTNDGDCGFLGQIEDDGTSAGDFTCDGGCSGTWSGEEV